MKSPVVLLESLIQDILRLSPGVKGLDRDIVTIKSRLKHEGDGFLTVALPALCDSLDQGLAFRKFTCPRNFSTVPGGRIPRLFSGIFCKVFDAVTGDLIEKDSAYEVKLLREALRLFKKMKVSSSREEILDFEARRSFFELEDNLTPISFSARESAIFERVSRIVLPYLDTFQDEELCYKHGPGAVHEGLSANQKWRALVPLLEELPEELYSYHAWYASGSTEGVVGRSSRGISKLITVPKNSTSRRTITVEPLLNQFLQQGLNTHLRSQILKCAILRNSLDLTDQSKNQKLALIGSRTDEWATIDLSSASDSISLEIVCRMLKDKPRFLSRLLDSRSTQVLSKELERPLSKFAGMGNATTFPIQSVLFAVLAICAYCDDVSNITYGKIRRASRSIRVYGDDIIVRVDKARSVVDWITKAGLKVNLRKSFLQGNFKESCGTDAYMGYDVTPLYVRCHPINVSKKDPSTIAHYVDLCNQAWFRGLYALSSYFQRIAEEALGKALPLVTRESSVLGLHSRQDTYEVHRWNSQLQRFELRGVSLVPKYRPDALDGEGALLKFFHLPFQEDAKHLERSPVRFRNRILPRWVAP